MNKIEELAKNIDRLESEVKEARKSNSEKSDRIIQLQSDLRMARQLLADAKNDPNMWERIDKNLAALADKEMPEFPTEFSLKETGLLLDLLKKILEKEPKEYPSSIKVSNLNDIKFPSQPTKWDIKGRTIDGWVKKMIVGFKGIIDNAVNKVFKAQVTGEVMISNRELQDAIPVVLTSRERRYFYDAMVSVLGAGGPVASDAKLDAILAAIQALSFSPASSVGDGTATVTTAGTAVQLSAQACRKVIIQAHENNTGAIAIGGSTVVAALVGRRGTILYPTQTVELAVANLNLIYVDSISNGDKINYTYEN